MAQAGISKKTLEKYGGSNVAAAICNALLYAME